jgi:hypothetical protein
MSFFSFTKLEKRRAEQVGWGWYQWDGVEEDVGNGCRRVNIVQILCTHLCKCKNEICQSRALEQTKGLLCCHLRVRQKNRKSHPKG